MTEEEFKEALRRDFGVESVEELWDKVIHSPELQKRTLIASICDVPIVSFQMVRLMFRKITGHDW